MDIGGESVLPAGAVDQLDNEQRSNINISDVFEAISIADPSFGPGVEEEAMYREPAPAQDARPRVVIVEQPASKALRFRYECEGRSAGSIPGAHSTPERKTYPTIEITGHRGRAVVVVSCVTKDEPYRPHPHNLVGRELCKKGVCTVNVSPETNVVQFSNLGIQCVKRRDIEEALRVREEMRVDPFKTGFSHKNQPQLIDLNAVRLCFQVFLPDQVTGKIRHALPPAVSDVIYDKKAMSDLVITRLSHCTAPVSGGQQVILLCEKVAREDIAVTFFEKQGETVSWQADAADVLVHKQVAICFTTPRYHCVDATEPVQAHIQLRRPTDNATSEPLPFELLPLSADPNSLKRKRQKGLTDFSRFLPQHERDMNQPLPEYYGNLIGSLQREQKPIKLEPRDKTPPHPMSSPQHYSPQRDHAEHYHQWNMQGEMVPGPSHPNLAVPAHGLNVPGQIGINVGQHVNQYQPQDMQWQHNIQSVSPVPQAMSPNLQAMSPNMQAMSPMTQMSPNMGHVSPNMGHMSPNVGHVSPNVGHMSPNMGHVSPNLVQQGNMAPMMPHSHMQESGTQSDPPSITGLLLDRGSMPQLTSGELAGLSGLLAPDMLTDSLTRLSTGDLLRNTDHNM